MDHSNWGDDPWADVDADTKTPPKPQPAPPTPTPRTSAPVLLNGFLDDAQWGATAEGDGWGGGWGAEDNSRGDDVSAKKEDTFTPAENETEDYGDTRHESRKDNTATLDVGNGGWDSVSNNGDDVVLQPAADLDNSTVASAPSDSGSTVQLEDESPGQNTVYPEDDLSVRSSTSPSDASHTGPPAESPRTSLEDDRLAEKGVQAVEPSAEDQGRGDTAENASESTVTGTDLEDEAELPGPPQSLLTDLFPPHNSSEVPGAPEDDPIHSTAARKAWYRLTRKQTMREFNNGGNDNNYVRVTWANSQVRLRVGRIVSRWAAEDRMAGRGAGGRASFYWDAPARYEDKNPTHRRTVSAMPTITSAQPLSLRRPSLTTDVPAAFNWNSPSAAPEDPWKTESPTSRAVPAPAIATSVPPAAVQPQQPRPTSESRETFKPEHRKTVSLISPPDHAKSSVPGSIDSALRATPASSRPSILSPVAEAPSPQTLDTDNAEEDDDDDWGEMVQSPTEPTFMEPFPESTAASSVLPPAPSNPIFPKSSPFHESVSREASPIVRLQGAVIPTSSLIIPVDKYIPASVNQGPIGPGLLKKTSSQEVAERFRMDSSPLSRVTSTPFHDSVVASQARVDLSDADVDTTTQSNASLAARSPSRNVSPTAETFKTDEPVFQAVPTAVATDPWQDADFSVFESAPPPPPPSSKTPEQLNSLLPREPSTPITVPQASATHFQSRKAADDDTIREIVSGLPDLSYMLQS